MRLSTIYVPFHGFVSLTLAFPSQLLLEHAARNDPDAHTESKRSLESRQTGADAATATYEPVPIFNAEAQYIDVSPGSGHEWQPPSPSDIRGPCPGLNAFANHGFLPRNGVATIPEFVSATETVVGMGPVLAIFLSALGAVLDGDGLGWSIGGTPPALLNLTSGLQGNGISNSHNKYESDASPTRPDLYEFGNDYMTRSDQFNQLIASSPGGAITLDALTAFRSDRFDTQIANNPYFWNGPFTGTTVQAAAYTFIYRFMANHSSDDPYGLLTYDTVASWFGMEGNAQQGYTAVQGHERIPENWYRRAIEYPYELTYLSADTRAANALHPKFNIPGGNNGTTNSFRAMNITTLTAGVFDGETLAQNNNSACLAYQFAAQDKPDILLGPIDLLTDALDSLINLFNCPQLQSIDQSQLEMYPGYTGNFLR